jgi:hypothetical protein
VLRRRLGVSDHGSLRPSLTSRYWPVTNRLSSEAREETTSATSSGAPRRPRAVWLSRRRTVSAFCRTAALPSVAIQPGATAFTVMPRGPSSAAKARVIASIAALVNHRAVGSEPFRDGATDAARASGDQGGFSSKGMLHGVLSANLPAWFNSRRAWFVFAASSETLHDTPTPDKVPSRGRRCPGQSWQAAWRRDM